MTDSKYELMVKIRNSTHLSPLRKHDFLNEDLPHIVERARNLDELIDRKLVETPVGSDSLYLTGTGIEILEAEMCHRNAEKKADARHRKETWRSVITIAISAATFLLMVLDKILH